MVKHLLSIDDLGIDEIDNLMQITDSFAQIGKRPIKKVPTLRGKTIINLFYESSTRTRTSFEIAGKRLSADVVNITSSTSATSKGESLKDTAKTICAMDVDAVVVRHSSSGAPQLIKNWLGDRISVVNAGDGMHEHPTQALLDLYTLKQEFGDLKGLNVCVLGDILHSRVARSVIKLFSKSGLNVSVFGPGTMIPPGIEQLGCKVEKDLQSALIGKDIVYLLRIQLERRSGKDFPSASEYAAYYGLNRQRFGLLKENVRIMHPGPINRGLEISSDFADMPYALIDRQVESGVSVRMAILFWLLAGDGELHHE